MKKKKKNNESNEVNELNKFMDLINHTTKTEKKRIIKTIQENGDDLLMEIEKRKIKKQKRKEEMIEYILKVDYPINTQYIRKKDSTIDECRDYLKNNFTFDEILYMYLELKKENKSFFQKLKDLFISNKKQ